MTTATTIKPQAPKLYAGQPDAETLTWFRAKYPNGITEKSSRAYARELYKTRPSHDDDPEGAAAWHAALTDFQRKMLADSNRQKDAEKDEKARIKFQNRFGLSDDESRKYWALRGLPPKPGEKQAEWQRVYNRLWKALKAAPRANADLSKMTPDEREEHRRAQNRKAQARSRANAKAAEVSAPPVVDEAAAEAAAIAKLDALMDQIDMD